MSQKTVEKKIDKIAENYARLQNVEALVIELFKLLDKKKPKGKEHTIVADLRKLVGA